MINIYILESGLAEIEAVYLKNMRIYILETALAHDDIVEDLAERCSLKNQKLTLRSAYKPDELCLYHDRKTILGKEWYINIYHPSNKLEVQAKQEGSK